MFDYFFFLNIHYQEQNIQTSSYKVTIFGEDGNYCTNPWIDFQHRYGLGSKGNQAFTYTAFKWCTPTKRIGPQHQELSCQVRIRSWPYEPAVPTPCTNVKQPPSLVLKSSRKLRRITSPCFIFKTSKNFSNCDF